MARFASTLRTLEHGLSSLSTSGQNGVLSQATEVFQKEAFIGAGFSVLSLDSTFVKTSPRAADALKKRTAADRADEGRSLDQDTCERRRPGDSGRAKTLAWERPRRARRLKSSSKS